MRSPRPSLPPHAHAFVDETKAKGYIMVAVGLDPHQVAEARRTMRALVPSGRFRLHFKKLSDRQRRNALNAFDDLRPAVLVARSSASHQIRARSQAWTSIIENLRDADIERVVIERDAPFQGYDEEVVRKVWPTGQVIHMSGNEEPLLWIADGVAWCLQRGGLWAQRVQPLVVGDAVVPNQ